VTKRLRRVRRGIRGGAVRPPQGVEPLARGFRGNTPEIFFFGPTYFRDDIFPGPHDI
jgi:hypothetical protein